MILNMFTVYDEKANAFLTPFFMHNTDMAIREFQNCINDPSHAFGRNPQDYTLYKISEFDDETAALDQIPTKQMLGNGVEFKISEHFKEQHNG